VHVLGVILGVAAASRDPRIVLVAGLSATFAVSVSMGAVAHTSTLADADYYEAERARELRHIARIPRLGRESATPACARASRARSSSTSSTP